MNQYSGKDKTKRPTSGTTPTVRIRPGEYRIIPVPIILPNLDSITIRLKKDNVAFIEFDFGKENGFILKKVSTIQLIPRKKLFMSNKKFDKLNKRLPVLVGFKNIQFCLKESLDSKLGIFMTEDAVIIDFFKKIAKAKLKVNVVFTYKDCFQRDGKTELSNGDYTYMTSFTKIDFKLEN